MDLFRRRKASPEELQEGRRQIEEAEERMARDGMIYIGDSNPRGEPPSKEDERMSLTTPVTRALPFSPLSGLVGPETAAKKEEEVVRNLQAGEVAEEPKELEDEKRATVIQGEDLRREEVPNPGGGDSRGCLQDGPLFDEEQLRRMNELMIQAPLLWGPREEPTLPRPQWLKEEEDRQLRMAELREKAKEDWRDQQRRALMLQDEDQLKWLGKMRGLEEEIQRSQKEESDLRKINLALIENNKKLLEDNKKLREGAREMIEKLRQFPDSPYGTPEGVEEGRKEQEAEKDLGKEGAGGETTPRMKTEEGGAGGETTPRMKTEGGGAASSPVDSKLMMKGMMKLMEGMQMMQSQILEIRKNKDVEVVKGSVGELPRLAEWRPETAPLDLTDWLISIEPAMGDLSDGSQQWWEEMITTSKRWYAEHQELTPLEKVSHEVTVPGHLQDPKFQRLEKRATALLMAAIPSQQQEEVIAAKEVSAIGVLTRLMIAYQPGGLSEKAAILGALDAPEEAQNLGQAVLGLRRWLRWHRRAGDIGVVRPDATIQVRGLQKLVKKILKDHADLAFRIQLAKSSLLIDTAPTSESVLRYANHLLAEIEQVAHQDKKKKEAQPLPDPKIKRFEEKGSGKGGEWKKEERGSRDWAGGSPEKTLSPTCKFFLTEQGCKKGKSCQFQHTLDDQKRCWNCGSSLHFSPKCDRPREGDSKGAKGEGKTAKVIKREENMKKEEGDKKEAEGSTEVMKGLLEEANKMLKAMSSSTGGSIEEGSKEQKLTRLQQQLDELKVIKVFKISKVSMSSGEGLLDSGATHSLRGKEVGEDLSRLKQIDVTLACGKTMKLRMTEGGTMVSEEKNVEPIIPLGKMVSVLRCSMDWAEDSGLKIWHPVHGWLSIRERGGCPHVPREMAMKLIQEIEDIQKAVQGGLKDGCQEIKKAEEQLREEERWLQEFVECHPVLKRLPEGLKKRLVVSIPEKVGKIPGVNKRAKKQWYKKGLTVHLFSGEPTGYHLEKALKEQGGDERRLLEVDIKKGPEFDMVEDPMYSYLLRLAMDDVIEAVICGPNCRTRSVLRHFPIPDQPDAPRPVRRWGGEEWGNRDNTEDERKVEEDDLMMWRSITLTLVSIHHRRATNLSLKEVQFLLEQPSPPKNFPEVVSFWRTEEWKRLCEVYGWKEVHFNQGDWGGKTQKPTTLGGTMKVRAPVPMKKRPDEVIRSSKELERWSPGMMKEVARWVVEEVQREEVRLKGLSWDEHIQLGHVPFRRDCKICQESRQKQHPHRKVKHPLSGLLSLDTSGPHKDGQDLANQARYMMVGAFTWLVPKEMKKMKEEEVELPEGAVDLEEWKDGRHVRKERNQRRKEEEKRGDRPAEEEEKERDQSIEDGEGREEVDIFNDPPEWDPLRNESQEERDRIRAPWTVREEPRIRAVEEEGEQIPEGWEIRVFRLVAPMASKKTEETLKTAIEFVLRLRADGFWVNQIHTDQGHEYYGQFKNWCSKRGIVLTRTAGDDSQGNGRAEVAVYSVNRQVRATLLQAGADVDLWPLAARHAGEVLRCYRIGKEVPDFPPFLQKVTVRKRNWMKGSMAPTCEEVRYLFPAWDPHGHWVMKDDGTKLVTRYVVKKVKDIPTSQEWIAIEEELVNALVKRRRMREKAAPLVRKVEEREEDEKKEKAGRVSKIIEEEMGLLIEEDPIIVPQVMEVIAKLKRMLEGSVDEEILQTRIVSPIEVLRDWHEWVGPAEDEVYSLLQEKKAFKEISSEELSELKKTLEEENRKIEIIPSKLVWTKKPDHLNPAKGKNKVRWVICGNFEEKKESEQTYSGGADSTALRAVVSMAADHQWFGATVDVKTAFLNAEMSQDEEEEVLVIRPPTIFLEKQVVKKGAYFIPQKAVYGLRRSPRLWGRCRDEGLRQLKIRVEGEEKKVELRMFQLDAEPNLWRISKEEEEHYVATTIEGLLMTYVDDMVVVGSEKVVSAVLDAIQEKWKTSTPEWISSEPVRFLGVEISKTKDENGEYDDWRISQSSYVQQLLKNEKEEVKGRKIPVSRELVMKMSEDEEGVVASEVKTAQKVVGELLWVVTRSKPDLMYVVSKMGSRVTKSPRMVVRAGDQVRGYLKSTQEDGIIFKKRIPDSPLQMNVFTDASFSPEGEESHGCVVVMMNDAPVAWKSSRQSVISLSTAESELLEIIEGFTVGESTAVVFEEIMGSFPKVLWSDSQSALSVLGGEGGSWRTRHLRMRAMYARQLVTQGSWGVHHCPGEEMVADIGTKALASTRLEFLKEKMGMMEVKIGSEEENEREVEEEEERGECQRGMSTMNSQQVQDALRLVIVMASMSCGQAQEEREEERLFWRRVMMVFLIIVLFAVIGVISMCRWMCEKRKGSKQPEEEPEKGTGEEGEEQRLRRRVSQMRERMSQESPQQLTPREIVFVRQQFEAVQRTPERRNWVEDPPANEPSQEPGTFQESFLAGGVVVVEDIQHPEDWDPEVHGDIPIGKGCPPQSYFQRAEKGKGSPFGGSIQEEEKGKGGKSEGKKGRSVWASHGSSASSVSGSSVTSVPPLPQGSGKGVGVQLQSDQFPDPPGHGKGTGRRRIFVTPYGTRYHVFTSCRSLRNTREIRFSNWCEWRSAVDSGERRPLVCCIGPGQDAHYDPNCTRAVGRQLRKCGICDEMDV